MADAAGDPMDHDGRISEKGAPFPRKPGSLHIVRFVYRPRDLSSTEGTVTARLRQVSGSWSVPGLARRFAGQSASGRALLPDTAAGTAPNFTGFPIKPQRRPVLGA